MIIRLKGNGEFTQAIKPREWKIQLTMAINFISSKNCDETRAMHTKSNNVEIMMGSQTFLNLFYKNIKKG